jgi:hypothetical protein
MERVFLICCWAREGFIESLNRYQSVWRKSSRHCLWLAAYHIIGQTIQHEQWQSVFLPPLILSKFRFGGTGPDTTTCRPDRTLQRVDRTRPDTSTCRLDRTGHFNLSTGQDRTLQRVDWARPDTSTSRQDRTGHINVSTGPDRTLQRVDRTGPVNIPSWSDGQWLLLHGTDSIRRTRQLHGGESFGRWQHSKPIGTKRRNSSCTRYRLQSLCWARSVQSTSSKYISLRSNLILYFYLRLHLPSCLFLQALKPESCTHFLLTHARYMHRPFHPPWFDNRDNIYWRL